MMIMSDFSDTESETSSSDKEVFTPQVKDTKVQQVSIKLPFADQVKQFAKENKSDQEVVSPSDLYRELAPIVPTKGHKYLLNLSLKDAKFSFSHTDSRLIESDSCEDEEDKDDVTVEKLT